MENKYLVSFVSWMKETYGKLLTWEMVANDAEEAVKIVNRMNVGFVVDVNEHTYGMGVIS